MGYYPTSLTRPLTEVGGIQTRERTDGTSKQVNFNRKTTTPCLQLGGTSKVDKSSGAGRRRCERLNPGGLFFSYDF